MFPSLPQLDPNPTERQCQLLRARDRYQYDYTYPPGIAMARSVPPQEDFSKRYIANVVQLNLKLAANHMASDLEGTDEERRHLLTFDVPGMIGSALRLTHRFRVGAELGQHARSRRADSLADFERMFAVVRRPPIVSVAYCADSQNSRAQNLAFAWQRIAGANPMELESFDVWSDRMGRRGTFPDHLPVTEEVFARALGYYEPMLGSDSGLTLRGVIEKGDLFVADYAPLASLPAAYSYRGSERYLAAPIALFLWIKPQQDELPPVLVPLAIQCGQKPGAEAPLFTPADGWAWVRARTFVQIADGNMHETVRHLAETHLVMESVILAVMRNLADAHPVKILLRPHFEFTLALNDVAKHNLIAPGGGVEQILAPPLALALDAVKASVEDFDLRGSTPPRALALRGLTQRDEDLPYRDDALRLFPIIEGFVERYLRLYYRNDDDLRGDGELSAFVAEVTESDASKPGGRLKGVGPIDRLEDLVELTSAIIWTASAQHACLNFAQFPYMGLVTNMPGAAYLGPPTDPATETSESYLKMLPPLDVAEVHFNLAYELSNVRENRLGTYPSGHFRDPRARELVVELQRELRRADSEIAAIDETRPMPYPYLRPSLVTASIHI